MNVWDNGYPSGGNYWRDYQTRYPNATEIDSSGIWNTPYVIDANNTDRYPLMAPPVRALVHDVAVTGVMPFKTIVGQGFSVKINVTVADPGGYTETFNITAYANTTAIATRTVTLASGNSTTITFTWNTAGLAYGNYTISGYAWPVLGETDRAYNTLKAPVPIEVTIPGDVDGNHVVNILDVAKIASVYGLKRGDPKFNSNCDIDGDGKITILDLVTCAAHYGEHW
jgi:hypothetical protein